MDIATLLGSYAFPVVACLGMAWYVKYITDKNSQETAELNKQHTKLHRQVSLSVDNWQ